MSTRGKRNSQTMPSRSRLSGLSPTPSRAQIDANTSSARICAGPIVTAAMMDATSTTLSALNQRAIAFRSRAIELRDLRCETRSRLDRAHPRLARRERQDQVATVLHGGQRSRRRIGVEELDF